LNNGVFIFKFKKFKNELQVLAGISGTKKGAKKLLSL
jgi:hypothetical protein